VSPLDTAIVIVTSCLCIMHVHNSIIDRETSENRPKVLSVLTLIKHCIISQAGRIERIDRAYCSRVIRDCSRADKITPMEVQNQATLGTERNRNDRAASDPSRL
jgi:hypothetical protein